MQRPYIYRCGATNTCAVTGEKAGSRLPALLKEPARPTVVLSLVARTTSVGTTALMTEAHRLSRSASFDPDTFNMLSEVLDEVWASI